jgi:sarcosine oxidase, subunit beta
VSRTADVVVVGGGVVGASAAYHLAAAGAGEVVLLERADRLAAGSTGACAGGFRQQFSTEVNIRLSKASVPMITRFTEEHGLPLDVAQDGYLFLVRGEGLWADFVVANALQRSLGVLAELLTPHEASELAPGVALDGVVGAAYGPEDGIADPSGLTQGYGTLARRAGATIELGVEVAGVRTVEGRTVGVSTATGDIDAPVVIDAAGPWAGLLAETAGITLPLEPIPRHVLVTGPFPDVPERKTLIIDAATSFYLHREGTGVLMGMGNPNERPTFDLTSDDAFVAEALLPTAVRVYPPLELAAIEHSWVGLYEMTPDRHPIVGASPIEGLYLATGFSGHGFQHAPVIGKVLSELVVDGAASTVDIAALSLDRFDRGQLVREGHVV